MCLFCMCSDGEEAKDSEGGEEENGEGREESPALCARRMTDRGRHGGRDSRDLRGRLPRKSAYLFVARNDVSLGTWPVT